MTHEQATRAQLLDAYRWHHEQAVGEAAFARINATPVHVATRGDDPWEYSRTRAYAFTLLAKARFLRLRLALALGDKRG